MLGTQLETLKNGSFTEVFKSLQLDQEIAQKQLDTLQKIESNTEVESNTIFS